MTLHMDLTRWSVLKSDQLCSMQLKIRSSVQSTKARPIADCDSDHELLIGKSIRPFRYDLNQILYNYTVEVMNRFKGLDQADRISEELWTEVLNIVQEAVTRTITKKKKCTVTHFSRCDPKDPHSKQVDVLCSSRTLCTKREAWFPLASSLSASGADYILEEFIGARKYRSIHASTA